MEFTEFVRAYQDMVYSTAIRIVGNAQEAEDIAQEVFITAYRRFADLSENPGAGGWLRTTARNLGINHVTRYRRRFLFLGLDKSEDDVDRLFGTDEDDGVLARDTEALKKALLSLHATHRVPLVLHYYEGLDYDEIARMLKISLSKVKTDLFRGRKKLREILDRMEPSYEQEAVACA
jgi:RNA polymerase sigma-70 factor (ECF subfamily)